MAFGIPSPTDVVGTGPINVGGLLGGSSSSSDSSTSSTGSDWERQSTPNYLPDTDGTADEDGRTADDPLSDGEADPSGGRVGGAPNHLPDATEDSVDDGYSVDDTIQEGAADVGRVVDAVQNGGSGVYTGGSSPTPSSWIDGAPWTVVAFGGLVVAGTLAAVVGLDDGGGE